MKKIRVILYQCNGDLLTSLSCALGRNEEDSSARPPEKKKKQTKLPDDNEQYVLHRASDIVNSMLLEDIKVSINNKPVIEQDPKGSNIDESTESMNPVLWKFVEQSTRSVRERHYSHTQSSH